MLRIKRRPCCKQPPMLIVCCPHCSSSSSVFEMEGPLSLRACNRTWRCTAGGTALPRAAPLPPLRVLLLYNVGWHNQVSGTARSLSRYKITLSAMLAQPPHHNNTKTSQLHQHCSNSFCKVNRIKSQKLQEPSGLVNFSKFRTYHNIIYCYSNKDQKYSLMHWLFL